MPNPSELPGQSSIVNASAAPRKRVMTVVGARPQFIKAAVVSKALRQSALLEEILIHTGQHFDAAMSDVFFKELGIPEPYCNLNVGPDAPSVQLAALLERLAPVIDDLRPDAVLVYGDTNSTVAAALAAAQKDIPIIHVEAGERIYRRRALPEEVNRVIIDNLAALNLASTRRAADYLLREGQARQRVRFVGDPLYDLFLWARPRLDELATLTHAGLGLRPGEYHLATIHRVQNTASRDVLLGLLAALDDSAWPVVLPVHPRVRKLLADWNWAPSGSLRLIEPLGYFDFNRLLVDCRAVFTDSGGVTREAFFARRPCVIPMEKCYWAEAVEHGWSVQVPLDRAAILRQLDHITPPAAAPEGAFGDGHAADAIRRELESFLSGEGSATNNPQGSSSKTPEGSDFSVAPGEAPRNPGWPAPKTPDPEGVQPSVPATPTPYPPASSYSDDIWLRFPGLADYPPERPATLTHAAYAELLASLRSRGYAFASFPEVEPLLRQVRPFVLIRHELDAAPEAALPLARLESAAGVRATYFVHPRSDLYNPFAPAAADAIRQILALGHALGLLCELAGAADPAAAYPRDLALLEGFFKHSVAAVTFLQDGRPAPLADPAASYPHPHTGLRLFAEVLPAFTDAAGHWRPEPPLASELAQSGAPFQLVLHPLWWHEPPLSPNEAVLRLIDAAQRAPERLLQYYVAASHCHASSGSLSE